MPAINLARLKTQASRLSEKFDKPEAFVHDLNEMLDYYTNRTLRSTQTAQQFSSPPTILPLLFCVKSRENSRHLPNHIRLKQ